MSKNIYAFTETDYKTYPGYISINATEDNAVTITVRTREESNCSIIALSEDELDMLVFKVREFYK